MFIDKHNLKGAVPAKEKGRYALNALQLTKHGVLSTDGSRAVLSPYPEVAPADCPKIEGVNVEWTPKKGEELLLHADDAKALLKTIPKKGLPAVCGAQIAPGVAGTTDLQSRAVLRLKTDIGQFPDVWSVLPSREEIAQAPSAQYDLDLLLDTLTALRAASRRDQCFVELRLVDTGDGYRTLLAQTKDGAAALQMGVKPSTYPPNPLCKEGNNE